MEKKSKYDTNPLDPDFVRRTEEVRGETGEVETGKPTEEQQERTRILDSGPADTEAPTRYYAPPSHLDAQPPPFKPQAQQSPFNPPPQAQRFGSQPVYEERANTSYPSVFIPPAYAPPQQPHTPQPWPSPYSNRPTARTVPGLGIPENLALILPYLPFPLVGAVPGVVELLLVPRTETRVRFHAAQGLVLHLAVLAVNMMFSMAQGTVGNFIRGPIPFMLGMASVLFSVAATVFFIISMIRVWRGEPHVFAPLTEAARWLNEKLEPRK